MTNKTIAEAVHVLLEAGWTLREIAYLLEPVGFDVYSPPGYVRWDSTDITLGPHVGSVGDTKICIAPPPTQEDETQ